ncbi:MAG: mechanosensitive ion channel family protein [Acholeplasmataceae bacterium]|nr:mechanosensitive ion channel family protein [Acholeplasmataceae bacterium]
MKFKSRPKSEKIRIIGVGVAILVFVLLGSLSNIIFPGSTFALVIENSIGKFFNVIRFIEDRYVTILESIAVLIFVWILNKIFIFIVYMTTKKGKRSETIGNLYKGFVKYLSFVIAAFLILKAWGIDTPTLLAGAGIIGLAVSFGAQSLLEDLFAGLAIIMQKQFSVGDIVQLEQMRGTVKEIGLRITKIEDLYGDVLLINNSDIKNVINTSSSLSVSICDISVEYGADLEKIEEIILKNLEVIRKKIPNIKEGPFYYGVEQLADSSVVCRVVAKTEEQNRHNVRRSLNREMKLLFDRNGINIPFPQVSVHQENQKL